MIKFDNKGAKHLQPNILPEIIRDVLQKGRLDYTPIFDKVVCGCGGTHSILNYIAVADEKIVLLTSAAVAVKDKLEGKDSYPNTTCFLSTIEKDNATLKSYTVFYTTPEYFQRVHKHFPKDKTVLIYDEFHDFVDSRSYRRSLQTVDRLGFARVGMTATVPPCFKKNREYTVENIYEPDFEFSYIEVLPRECNVHVDQAIGQIMQEVHEVIDKKPHVVVPDVKQVLKFVKYAELYNKKILLKLGHSGDFVIQSLENKDHITYDQTDYDLSVGTVAGTAGIDLEIVQDECYVFICSMSKNNDNVGFTEEQGLQAAGRFRNAKKTYVRCYTDCATGGLCSIEYGKIKKKCEQEGYINTYHQGKVKNALINVKNKELYNKYGIYEIQEDKEYVKYLKSLSRNRITSDQSIWEQGELDYKEPLKLDASEFFELLTFKINIENKNDNYSKEMKMNISLYKLPEKYKHVNKEYIGFIQSIVYEHIDEISEGDLIINTCFGDIKYKFLDEKTVQITDFPDIASKIEIIEKEYQTIKRKSCAYFTNLLNRKLSTEKHTTILQFKRMQSSNKMLKDKEDLKTLHEAFKYVNNSNGKHNYFKSFLKVQNNFENNKMYELFFDVCITNVSDVVYNVLFETQGWRELSKNKHRLYGQLTRTNKEIRSIILNTLYGDNWRRIDIKSCAPTTTAIFQLKISLPESKDFYESESRNRDFSKQKLNQFLNYKHKEKIDRSWVEQVKTYCTDPNFIDKFVDFHENEKMRDNRLVYKPLYFDSYTLYEKNIIKHLSKSISKAFPKARYTRLHDEMIIISKEANNIQEKIKKCYKYPVRDNEHMNSFNPFTLQIYPKTDIDWDVLESSCSSSLGKVIKRKKKVKVLNTQEMKPKNYTIVNNSKEVEEYISKYDTLAYDTETTGLNIRNDEVVMISLTGTGFEGIAWPIQRWDKENQQLVRLVDRQEVKRVLDPLANKKIITHNFLFDGPITQNDIGVDLRDSLHFDTMLAYHTLYEEECDKKEFRQGDGAGLKVLAQKHLGETTDEQQIMQKSITANGGKKGELYKADIDKLGKYACMDTDFTFRLYELFEQQMKDDGTYEYFYKERIPTYTGPSYSLNTRGMKVDFDLNEKLCEQVGPYVDQYLKEFRDEVVKDKKVFECFKRKISYTNAKKLIKSELNIARLTKDAIVQIEDENIKKYLESRGLKTEYLPDELVYKLLNPRSNVTVGQVAREVKLRRAGKDDDWKERNKDVGWVRTLYQFKKFDKIASTYILKLQNNCEKGIYYPLFKDTGTVSGRYSSNLQQLPRAQDKKEDDGLNETYYEAVNSIRKQFVPREGYVFLDADYESLEPHIFAELSQDPKLIQIYNKGLDYHSYIAIIVEDLKGFSPDKKAPNYLGKVRPDIRAKAKSYSLGIPYGMGAMGIADIFKCSVDEGQVKIDRFYNGLEKLSKWRQDSIHEVDTKFKINIKSGNVRHFQTYERLEGEHPGSYPYKKARSKAHNAVINVQQQSYAASIVNKASIRIQKYLEERDWGGIVINVHDQIVVEIKEEHADIFIPIMKDMLENTTKLKHVTLKAKPEKAYNLAEGH